MSERTPLGRSIEVSHALRGLRMDDAPAPLAGARWYVAEQPEQGLQYRFEPGRLAGMSHLTADMLLDGPHLAVFELRLQEGEHGPRFALRFGLLIQCSARVRVPLSATDQQRWMLPREGAWLKPICSGAKVDPARVDRAELVVLRKSDAPVRWCMTDWVASDTAPPRLTEPLLPKGPLLDGLGQLRLADWPGKTRDVEEMVSRLRQQAEHANEHRWPESMGPWGGWREKRVPEATGFFHTHHDGQRWWLVDPQGQLFWSSGCDCVRPGVTAAYETLDTALPDPPPTDGPFAAAHEQPGKRFNHMLANLIHAFGPERWQTQWEALAMGQLKAFGFNTVANWSDWRAASRARFPYVRPLTLRFERTPRVFRDFPDVFDPAIGEDLAAFGQQLAESADDPAMIGYFLMNEPTWGFAELTPAEGMLVNSVDSHTRRELGNWLQQRHGSDEVLARAWEMPVTLAQIARGPFDARPSDAAKAELQAFSTIMARRLFDMISQAARRVDANHLNLGVRYHTVPPAWCLEAMTSFDVFSMNCYRETVPAEQVARVAELLGRPVMIGEWHFGALDVGLPATGIGHVPDQHARGQAYRRYLEHAASLPACIGVHWFTLYDQSALGRPDGEGYNIGFIDVAGRPYPPLADAARQAHERMHAIADGQVAPTTEAPQYLPRLFL